MLNVNRINHPENFQHHHREMLQLFADHAGAVIERAGVLDRLGSRTRELEEVNLRLNELNHLKDVFLSTASHELKTPLTSVIGYAELLDDNDERMTHDQRGEFLRRLRGEADRLLGLIEDILDLTRIESGKLTLRRVSMSVNEIAHAAVETTRSLADKHGVELVERLDADLPPVLLDEVKMRQVLVNLLVQRREVQPRARPRRAGHLARRRLRAHRGDRPGRRHRARGRHAHLRAVRPGRSTASAPAGSASACTWSSASPSCTAATSA